MTRKEELKISGLMKTTLLDFPGHVACTVFLTGCNMRCPFCHNPRVVFGRDELLGNEDVFSFLKKRVGILDGVCITGGEPTLYGDALVDLARYIKGLGYLLKLDTNGTSPDMLGRLIGEGLLDYIAMDVKSALTDERYSAASGSAVDLDAVKESIRIIKESGTDYEFRTTVVGGIHTKEDIEDISAYLEGGKRYFLQAFTDSGDLIDNGSEFYAFSKEEMESMAEHAGRYIKTEVRGI